MVGVPGRSKACRTCRKRRKGCDQKQPICGQCKLSCIPCGGYDQPRIFVNSGQGHRGGKDEPYVFEAAAYSVAKLSSKDHISVVNQLSSPVFDKSLERTAGEIGYTGVYWQSLLPHGQAFPLQAAQYSTTSWTNTVQDLYRKDHLVRVVLLASAITLTAQRTQCSSAMVHGRRLYGMSLQAMARSIEGTQSRSWGSMLASSGLLAGYELLLNADRDHSCAAAPRWLSHTSGEMAIILAAGPESFIDGPEHQLFIDYRLHVLYPYLQKRQRYPLNTPEWKTVPWSTHPKSPKDNLVDILAELPGILEDMGLLTTWRRDSEERLAFCQTLKDRCWQCDHLLQAWATSSGQDTVAFVEGLIASEDLEGCAKLASRSFDLAVAHLGMIYWTTCNLLSQILSKLMGASACKGDATLLPPRMNAYMYSRKVALLIPYFKKPEVGSYLLSFIGFPVTVAASFLARRDPTGEFAEARALLARSFRGPCGKQLQIFLAAWPWITRPESATLGMHELDTAAS